MPGARMTTDGGQDHGCRQTGAAAAAPSEMARARPARARADDPLRRAAASASRCRSLPTSSRARSASPWLWLQEVTSTFFIYAIFIGAAVATRRNDHLYLTAISEALHGTPRLVVEIIIRLVVLGVAFCLICFGYINFSARLRQLPHAVDDADRLALCGDPDLRRADRAVHHRAARQRLRNGFDHPEPPEDDCGPACRSAARRSAAVSAPVILGVDDVLLPVLRLSRRAGAVLADGGRVHRRAASPTCRSPRSSRRCSTAWIPRRCSPSRSSCWSAS